MMLRSLGLSFLKMLTTSRKDREEAAWECRKEKVCHMADLAYVYWHEKGRSEFALSLRLSQIKFDAGIAFHRRSDYLMQLVEKDAYNFQGYGN